MTTRPPRRGRRRRAAAEAPGAVEELWATVLRRFRDHLHGARPEGTQNTDREDPR